MGDFLCLRQHRGADAGLRKAPTPPSRGPPAGVHAEGPAHVQERALPAGPGPRPSGSAGTVGTGRDGGDSARPKGTVGSCVLSCWEPPPTSSPACGSPAAQERWPHGASQRPGLPGRRPPGPQGPTLPPGGKAARGRSPAAVHPPPGVRAPLRPPGEPRADSPCSPSLSPCRGEQPAPHRAPTPRNPGCSLWHPRTPARRALAPCGRPSGRPRDTVL